MKTFQNQIIYFIVSIISIPNLFSIPATPYPVKITQPDGSQITIRMHGDENFNYKTTLDGYVLATDEAGILNYGQIDTNGKLTNTAVKATEIEKRTNSEKKFLQTLKPNPDLTRLIGSRRAIAAKKMSSASNPQKAYPITGSPKSLVILVNFSDVKFTTASPQTAFSNLLNQSGYSANGGTGSAKDYFRDASMGFFNPQFDVIGPVTLANTMEYYGGNDAQGNDLKPQQMVIDACTKASGLVDFSQYDTDNNGIVDNVFIYYAGYNEADGGSANSIWPHKWNLNNSYTKFNGVTIYNYACTSELRTDKDETGSNRCGIGTFCHEFGHVLGLEDYYDTSATQDYHHTLSVWNIMDYGAYLNLGRTPPTYCAYDRYFLKWLIPTQLDLATDYSLENIATSNKAYLISQTINRAQNPANDTNSPEYFTLENRQKSGWDFYLPYHGMIIYHIYYNASAWADNGPNNNASAMGVDIVEADGIAMSEQHSIDATLSGDPFPGAQNVSSFKPQLRDGTKLTKNISSIKETNGVITFHYGATIVTPVANDASDIKITGFVSNWTAVPNATGYYLSVFRKVDDNEIYDIKEKWIRSNSDTLNNLLPGTQYYYKVKASDKKTTYEDITDFSNTISVSTNSYPFATKLLANVEKDGNITVYLPKSNSVLYIYDILGKLVKMIVADSTVISLTDLEKNRVYILKSDHLITKIIK